MAFTVLNIEGTVLETLESEEQVTEFFNNEEVNVFWDDEGLVESLKENHPDNLDNLRIVKRD
jgi:hypothetical protein